MENDEIYYSGKTFFYSLLFFLLFVIAPIIYYLDPAFKMIIDLQYQLIREDWQLTLVFILLVGITIGHLMIEGLALLLLGAFMRINFALEHRFVKIMRFWLSTFLIFILCLAMIFDMKDDIILVISLSVILTSVLLFFEMKAQIFTKVREISQGQLEIGEYIEFDGKTWFKIFVYLGTIIILILMYWRNLLGFQDWVNEFLEIFENNMFLMACLWLFLIFTIFWKFIQFIMLLIPILCSFLLKDVVSRRIYRTKVFILIFIASVLVFKNLPFLPVDENLRFSISLIAVVLIEIIRWRLRLPRV